MTNPLPVPQPTPPWPGHMLSGTATYPPTYTELPSWHICGGIPGDICDCAEFLAECAAAMRSPLRISVTKDEPKAVAR